MRHRTFPWPRPPQNRPTTRPACVRRPTGCASRPTRPTTVHGHIVISGTWVLPITIAPAARSRATTSESTAFGAPNASVPHAVTSPATSASSLIATGTPRSGRVCVRRTTRVGFVGLGEGLLGEHDPVGLERRVQRRDALERGFHQLARRHLAFADQTRLLVRSGVRELGLVGQSSSASTSPMILVASCAGSGSPPSAFAISVAKSSTAWTPPTRT